MAERPEDAQGRAEDADGRPGDADGRPDDARRRRATPHRDIVAYDERSGGYDGGWRGRMHHRISDSVAALAVDTAPGARSVLDVGCGTGYLLRRLATALPRADRFVGIDPAPGMIRVATESTDDARFSFAETTAEHLDADHEFDLVVSATSFDHWSDQRSGLVACARALRRGGRLVLCDQFSALLIPTLKGSRRGKARTMSRANTLLAEAGFGDLEWHGIYTVLIRAVTATVE
jgi:ubiquinone/menaquinone biosynthesis C-methylase UbiE